MQKRVEQLADLVEYVTRGDLAARDVLERVRFYN
jgi:hypothetical protein